MRIAVLRGGPSRHYDDSLKTGSYVLSLLRAEPERYRPTDVFISKGGEWHVSGVVVTPEKVLNRSDLVWNALHGEYGDDGHIAQYLNQLQVPHTGSGTLGLSLSSNKDLAKNTYLKLDLLTPKHEVVSSTEPAKLVEIFRTYLHPVIVKPVSGRESHSIKKVYTYPELVHAIEEALRHYNRAIVEEFLSGDDVSCGVIEGFRGRELYTLIPTPNKFKSSTHKKIEEMAKAAHRGLGLRHYSLSDFIVTPKGKIYILETNALPSLNENSRMHGALASVGVEPKEFVNHVISLAI